MSQIRTRHRRSLVAVIAILAIAACAEGSGRPPVEPPSPPPLSPTVSILKRLSPGPHLGYIVGFDVLDTRQMQAASNYRREAINAGMSIGRVQLDWAGLEPSPGVFDAQVLADAFVDPHLDGLELMVTVSTLDTGELTIPADLLGSDGNLRSGLRFDSTEVRDRFAAFLDWLVPQLTERNVWGLSLGNEASTNFHMLVEPDTSVVAFFRDGANHVRSLDPDLAVSVTMATSSGDAVIQRFLVRTMDHLDFAAYNNYCIDGQTLVVNQEASWRARLADDITLANGREIFYQELGCPAGYDDLGGSVTPPPASGLNGTPEIQTAFFDFMMNEIATDNQIRAATIFQLYDWSPELTDMFNDTLFGSVDEPGLKIAIARLKEWLETVGMCRWSDSNCRPAWDSFLAGTARLKAIRDQL